LSGNFEFPGPKLDENYQSSQSLVEVTVGLHQPSVQDTQTARNKIKILILQEQGLEMWPLVLKAYTMSGEDCFTGGSSQLKGASNSPRGEC